MSPLFEAGERKPAAGKPRRKSIASGLLYKEYLVLSQHAGWHPSLPILPVGCFGDDGVSWRWLATQRLGTTLRSALGGKPAPFSTVATLALQLIDVLAHVHAAGWVYIDVNADNILLGGTQPATGLNIQRSSAADAKAAGGHGGSAAANSGGAKFRVGPPPPLSFVSDRAYLIDFGLATQFRGVSAPTSSGAEILGTPLFCSSSPTLSPRGDLESLGYLLVYVAAGRAALPWASEASPEACAAAKVATPHSTLVNALPSGPPRRTMSAYWNAISGISSAAAVAPMGIDYAQLKAIFAPFADSGGRLMWPSATKMERGASSDNADEEAVVSSVKRKRRKSPSPAPAAGSATISRQPKSAHAKALSKAHAYVLSLRKS